MRSVAALMLAATLAVLTGCSAPETPPPASSPSATAKPVFGSDEEALAAAEKAYTEYLRMSDRILAGGGEDPERIASLAVGRALEDAYAGYDEFRQASLRSVGSTTLKEISLQQVNASAESGAVIAYVCLDVSEVDVVDGHGRSVVESSRPPLQAFEAVFDMSSVERGRLILASREPRRAEGIC
jgi:hypothetical protein